MFPQINNKYKTMLCRHWETLGTCYMGAKCHFAHGKQDLRSISDPLPVSTQVYGYQNSPSPTNDMPTQNISSGNYSTNNFKTIKCKYFEQGWCKYDKHCTFAHGDPDPKDSFSSQMKSNFPQTTMNLGQSQMDNQQALQEINNRITHLQLQSIINNIEIMKPTNPTIISKLKLAGELWIANNNTDCASLLNEIIYRQDATPEEAETYKKILMEAQSISTLVLAQYNMNSQMQQQPQMQSPMQQQQMPMQQPQMQISMSMDQNPFESSLQYQQQFTNDKNKGKGITKPS